MNIRFYKLLCILALVVFLSRCGRKLFQKRNILDKPGKDLHWTRKPVPTMQGIFVYLIFIIVIWLFFPEMWTNRLMLGFLAWWTLIVIAELITELEYIGKIKFKLPAKARFVVQLVAACLALRISWIHDFEFMLGTKAIVFPQRALYIAFALRSTFITNAVNRIDWINAQWNWILTIWFFTIFWLIQRVVFPSYTKYTNYDTLILVQQLSLVLAIISLVYTVIEFKPLALIRDVGTMFLWFGLAYLSVLWWTKIWTVIVTLSLVIFDAIWIIFYRVFILKKSPMQWDFKHMHHRLLRLWWTRWEVRGFVWIRSIIMMILMLLQWANRINKLIIFSIMALLFFGVNVYLFLIKKLPCWLDDKKEDHFELDKQTPTSK